MPSLVSSTQMEPTAESLASSNLVLEVFATGDCETTRVLRKTYRENNRGSSKSNQTRDIVDIVDRRDLLVSEVEEDHHVKHVRQIDFRLCKEGVVLGEWRILKQNENELDTPYFYFHSNSGWFVRTTNHIQVKSLINIDSAAALLIAHICINYFSMNPIQTKLPDPPRNVSAADSIIGQRPWVAHYDKQSTNPTPVSTNHIPSQAPPLPPPRTTQNRDSQPPSAPPLQSIHVVGIVQEEVPVAVLVEGGLLDEQIPEAEASVLPPTAKPI